MSNRLSEIPEMSIKYYSLDKIKILSDICELIKYATKNDGILEVFEYINGNYEDVNFYEDDKVKKALLETSNIQELYKRMESFIPGIVNFLRKKNFFIMFKKVFEDVLEINEMMFVGYRLEISEKVVVNFTANSIQIKTSEAEQNMYMIIKKTLCYVVRGAERIREYSFDIDNFEDFITVDLTYKQYIGMIIFIKYYHTKLYPELYARKK